MTHNNSKTFLINLGIVSVTSVFAKTLTAPLERIKLILQNQDSALQVITQERKKYNGIIDCLLRLPKEQGILSLWRGNGTNLVRYFPMQALNFAFNDLFKFFLYKHCGFDLEKDNTLIKFLAGGMAGAGASTLIYPLEFCQTRISVDIGSDQSILKSNIIVKREFSGLGDCIKHIFKTSGVKGLYTGYPIAIVGVTIYRALYFGLYETIKNLWPQENISGLPKKPPLVVELIIAQSATCFAGLCAYPMDTVSRRLMLDAGRPKELQLFTSYKSISLEMYKKEGILAFYKGALTNCLRGVSGALVLVLYDEILHYTNWKKLF